MRLTPLFFIACIIAGSAAPSPVDAHVATTTVTITDAGFAPREITIDTSATVLFVNKDVVDHWPASNSHPQHDQYPEFDPQRAIPPSEWWSFHPTRVGTWHYHDHLNPHRNGTIIVTAEQGTKVTSSAEATITATPAPTAQPGVVSRVRATFKNWIQYVTNFFRPKAKAPRAVVISASAFVELSEQEQYAAVESLAQNQGLEHTWRYVKEVFTATEARGSSGRAHDLAHLIGGLIFKDRGLAGLSVCDPTFAFGCYHGFTAGAFESNLDLLVPVAHACEQVGTAGGGPWSSCIHGIGHGVATFFNATDLMPALTTCDQLGQGAPFCHDGVFMEFATSAPKSFYDRAKPLSPCDTLAEVYQPACGRNIVQAMHTRFGFTAEQVGSACISAHAVFTSACIDTVGFSIANEEGSVHERLVARCKALPQADAQWQCAAAAAGELVFQNAPNWKTEAPATCEALAATAQAPCHARVQQTMQNYGR